MHDRNVTPTDKEVLKAVFEGNWKSYDKETQIKILDIFASIHQVEGHLEPLPTRLVHASGVSLLQKIPLVGNELASMLNEYRQKPILSLKKIKDLDKLDAFYLEQQRIEKNYSIDDQGRAYLNLRIEKANSQALELISKYNMDIKKIAKETQCSIKSLLDIHNQKESNLHNHDEKKASQATFDNAQDFFQGLNNIGTLFHNRHLQVVASLGGQTVSMAKNAMSLIGTYSSAGALGMNLLIPGANVALTAMSIVSFLGRKKGGAKTDPNQELLQKISQQIQALRQEIHARFDNVDAELADIKIICSSIFKRLVKLEDILHYEFDSIRYMLTLMDERTDRRFDSIETEIKEMGSEILYHQITFDILNPLRAYLKYNTNTSLLEKLYNLESYLLNDLCKKAKLAWSFDENHRPDQVAKIAKQRIHSNFSYLISYAKIKLHVPINTDVELPNINLWEEGVSLALATCEKMNFKNEIISSLKNKTFSMIRSIDEMSINYSAISQSILTHYQTSLNKLQNKIIDILCQQEAEELKVETHFRDLNLPSIKPIISANGCTVQLEVKRLQTLLNTEKISSYLHKADILNLGHWELTYSGTKLPGYRGTPNHHGKWHYSGSQTPAMPTYAISVKFISGDRIIDVLSIQGQTYLPVVGINLHGREANIENQALCTIYNRAQENIPLDSLVLTHWPQMTITKKTKAAGYEEKAMSIFSARSLVTHQWNQAKNNVRDDKFLNELLKLNANKLEFKDILDELESQRALLIAYTSFINASAEIITELNNIFIVDLTTLLNNPTLFQRNIVELNARIMHLIARPEQPSGFIESKEIMVASSSSFYPSPIKSNLLHLSRLIEMFEYEFLFSEQKAIHNNMIMGRHIPALSFKTGELLGKGGFGSVYSGQLTLHGKLIDVAIKVIDSSDDASFNNFKKEIECLFGLDSNYLVKTYGYSVDPDKATYSILMELGTESLNKRLDRKELPLSIEKKIKLILEMAKGLRDLHSKGIFHGDFKSLNIILDSQGHAKLADFGLAQTKDAITTTATTKKTLPKEVLGSILWEAPEMLESGATINPPSDIYSFGVVLWEILVEERPFQQYLAQNRFRHPLVNITQILTMKERESVQPIPPDAPSELADIIRKCWLRDPSSRPTASNIVDRLERAFAEICGKVTVESTLESKGTTATSEDLLSTQEVAGVKKDDDFAVRINNAASNRSMSPVRLFKAAAVEPSTSSTSSTSPGLHN